MFEISRNCVLRTSAIAVVGARPDVGEGVGCLYGCGPINAGARRQESALGNVDVGEFARTN